VAVVSTLGAWLAWVVAPSHTGAVHAGTLTGVAAVVSVVWWRLLLRPRVELRDDVVVIVNPLATYQLRREDVVTVTDGWHGAEFHRRDGFKITAVALGDRSAGIKSGRLEEVRRVLTL
jgi:hypothetical protein